MADLGRVRVASRSAWPVFALACGVDLLLGLLFAALSLGLFRGVTLGPQQQLAFRVVTAICVLGGVGTGLFAWVQRRKRTEFCERGVREITLRAERDLLYESASGFTYFERQRKPGGPERALLQLWPTEGPAVTASVVADAADLAQLRDDIAAAIARGMGEKLLKSGRIQWLPGLALTPRELLVGSRDGKNEVAVPIDSADLQVADGFFQLRLPGDAQPLFQSPCDTKNFYPGWTLVRALGLSAAR